MWYLIKEGNVLNLPKKKYDIFLNVPYIVNSLKYFFIVANAHRNLDPILLIQTEFRGKIVVRRWIHWSNTTTVSSSCPRRGRGRRARDVGLQFGARSQESRGRTQQQCLDVGVFSHCVGGAAEEMTPKLNFDGKPNRPPPSTHSIYKNVKNKFKFVALNYVLEWNLCNENCSVRYYLSVGGFSRWSVSVLSQILLFYCTAVRPSFFSLQTVLGFLSSKPSSLVVMVMVMEVVWSLFSFFVLRLSLSFSLKKDIHD